MMIMPSDDVIRSGPSVDSEIREERILARRLRIEKRREEQLPVDHADETAVEKLKEEISHSHKQLKLSVKASHKLKLESLEVISNIRVVEDANEIKRRIKVNEDNEIRKEKVKNEKEIAFDKHEEINQKWQSALEKVQSQELHEMLLIQKEACDAMLEEKTKLINEFKAELKEKDKQYVDELKNQAIDTDLLINRMSEQINLLFKNYKAELKHIEAAFIQERVQLLAEMDEEWENLLRERKQKEEDFSKNRDNQVEIYEKLLDAQRVQDSEEYNQIKIKLEKDIQIMQQELQEMQATYQLNQDKLEYNFQVLRKRDEENIITKSIQKKKITHLHDVYMFHKKKNMKQEDNFAAENYQLTQDYGLLVEKYKNFLKKAKLTIDNNKGKFGKVWLMNEDECKRYASRILNINQILHEQQLGIKWTSPDISFMDNVGPISVIDGNSKHENGGLTGSLHIKQNVKHNNLVSKACGIDIKNLKDDEVNFVGGQETGNKNNESSFTENANPKLKEPFCEDYFYEPLKVVDECLDKVPKHLIKHIFKLICNETGFLIEEKVWSLLSSLNINEQTLMKLDSVFNVMQIEDEEEIKALSLYFLKKGTKNKIINKDKNPENKKEFSGKVSQHSSDYKKMTNDEFISPYPSNHSNSMDEDDTTQRGASEIVLNVNIPEYHEILIHPNDVLLALKAFVNEYNKNEKIKFNKGIAHDLHFDDVDDTNCEVADDQNKVENKIAPLSKPKIKDILMKHDLKKYFDATEIAIVDRDDTKDEEYWSKYANLNLEGQKTWDSLAIHFENYHRILEDRAKLIEQHKELIRQNIEMTAILQHCRNGAMNSYF